MISIHNIYYMLTYAFKALSEQGYKSIDTESFHNTADLMAAILEKGIAIQVKRGLQKDYILETSTQSSLKGKIDISESLKVQSILKKQMVCSFDSFSINTTMNRVIKSTVAVLLKGDIAKERKKSLRKLMVYFKDVTLIDLKTFDWHIQYNSNNQSYRLLLSICHLVVKGLLQTNSDGSNKLMDFLDEQHMCKLYEKFILEYYRKEYPKLKANASQIKWQVDDGVIDMLPIMQSDIMLSYKNDILIIDAKYYSHTVQKQYDTYSLHSANLYQIFTYVKNKEVELSATSHNVAGLLLYAKTNELVFSNNTYQMSGNRISAKTLDLNVPFTAIKNQLNKIVDEFFCYK